MRRYTRQVLVLALLMLVICFAVRLLFGSTLHMSVAYTAQSASDPLPVVEIEEPDVIRVENAVVANGEFSFDVVPLKKGASFIRVLDQNGEPLDAVYLSVDRFLTVFNDATGGFTGDLAVMIVLTVFLLLISAIVLHGYLAAKGPAFYSYSTVFYIGFFFFALVTGLTMLNITLRHIVMGENYSMYSVYYSLSSASVRFLNATSPIVLFFSVALAVSNIALLRHNRPRIQNAVGLIISFLMLAGCGLGIWICARPFAGSLLEYRIRATVENVYCTIYVYFECILAGAVVCARRAARHCPPADRNIIIILGCWFRKDGSLPPLLRGRVDRALEYWHQHLEQTGREAYIIPAGGQGKDESMPEAEAIKAYLISKGIPEQLILPESRSSNTLENLSFSRAIMEEHGLSGNVVIATTNYHVFRSGMWAVKAGLRAEGIGSRTKWWFWPNAFIRECVGLIVNKWKRELVLLALLVVFFGMLSMTVIG